jgi:hypothetical protein
MVVSPMTLNLNCEKLEGAGMVLSPRMVMTLEKLDGVEMVLSPSMVMTTLEKLDGVEMVLSPSMVMTTLQKLDGVEMVLSPRMMTTLNLKGEENQEMQTHATMLEGPDSDAAACPAMTRTNRVEMNQTNQTTKAG